MHCQGLLLLLLFLLLLLLRLFLLFVFERGGSVVGTAAAVGHMTLPNIVGRAISWSSYKYDAFIYIEVGCNVAVFVLAVGVVLHLWRSFTPTSGIGSASHDRKRVVEVEMTEAI